MGVATAGTGLTQVRPEGQGALSLQRGKAAGEVASSGPPFTLAPQALFEQIPQFLISFLLPWLKGH